MRSKKLLVSECFKTYEVVIVSRECFNNSSEIEICGSMVGFKIHNEENLQFRINELKNKGFKVIP